MPQDQISLSGLYPDLGPEELGQINQFYDEYVKLICGVFERDKAEAWQPDSADSNN